MRARCLLALLPLLLLPACGGGDQPGADPSAAASTGGPTGRVVVFAAASLTEAFGEIATQVEAASPGLDVVLNLGASSGLAQQVVAGAPADVFAAASPATMATVVDAGDATGPTVFARNRLELAVPPGNPGGVLGLADLARPALRLALCAPQVPCGAAATKVLAAAGVRAQPDTLEQDVKAVLAKVRLGEVDAGLVYRTDVRAAGDDVEGVTFPEADDAVGDYPLVALSGAANPEGAAVFVAAVLGPEGQEVLRRAGFDPAP